ncbi:hypothetical protein ACFU9X_22180 [Streptomyces atratus]|uniref:hypothetical protein n=1 Tax=Streptomyces atratus TaxID=1893 RepID=UPI0036B40AFE
MAQPLQVFEAPGDPEEPLPITYEGWTFERSVLLPLWDWYLILDEARKRDKELGSLLIDASGSADPRAEVAKTIPVERYGSLMEFIERLADEFARGVDLAGVQAELDLGDYDSSIYAEFLRATAAVLKEAHRLDAPFRSWSG